MHTHTLRHAPSGNSYAIRLDQKVKKVKVHDSKLIQTPIMCPRLRVTTTKTPRSRTGLVLIICTESKSILLLFFSKGEQNLNFFIGAKIWALWRERWLPETPGWAGVFGAPLLSAQAFKIRDVCQSLRVS